MFAQWGLARERIMFAQWGPARERITSAQWGLAQEKIIFAQEGLRQVRTTSVCTSCSLDRELWWKNCCWPRMQEPG